MNRQFPLKTVLLITGALFSAGIIPLTLFFSKEPAIPMIMSLYVTLGIFLLLSIRNPQANRTLILFAGWANLAHSTVMSVQLYLHVIEHTELYGVIVFAIAGIFLVALAPPKQTTT